VVEAYLSLQGLRWLGSGELNSEGLKGPGEALPLAMTLASGNPIGLIVSSESEVSARRPSRAPPSVLPRRSPKSSSRRRSGRAV